MPRNPIEKCSVSWEDRYGTTFSGNLPQYKVPENTCAINIDNITYPGVKLGMFRTYHIKCPYSTQATVHLARNTNINDPDYFKMEPVVALTDHADTNGVMIRESRGSRHGWLCVDDDCYYYNTITSSGGRYFHR